MAVAHDQNRVAQSGDNLVAQSGDNLVAQGSNLVGDVGVASSTATGLAVGRLKKRLLGLGPTIESALATEPDRAYAVGLASLTNAAFSAAPERIHALSLASTAETAFAAEFSKAGVAVGLASETDTSLAIQALIARLVGLAETTATGFAATPERVYAVALGQIIDEALPVITTGAKTIVAQHADEVDSALASTILRAYAIGQSSEADSAFVAAFARTIAAGIAATTSSAFATTILRTFGIGIAQSDVMGLPVTGVGTKIIVLGRGLELPVALAVVRNKARFLGVPGESDLARPVAVVVVPVDVPLVGVVMGTSSVLGASIGGKTPFGDKIGARS